MTGRRGWELGRRRKLEVLWGTMRGGGKISEFDATSFEICGCWVAGWSSAHSRVFVTRGEVLEGETLSLFVVEGDNYDESDGA